MGQTQSEECLYFLDLDKIIEDKIIDEKPEVCMEKLD
jgi:hypothetical protein